jgi:hypothetical protein
MQDDAAGRQRRHALEGNDAESRDPMVSLLRMRSECV